MIKQGINFFLKKRGDCQPAYKPGEVAGECDGLPAVTILSLFSSLVFGMVTVVVAISNLLNDETRH